MVVGGVPVPHNNKPERVAKAALEMCANPRQGWHSLDLPLSVPIGMATGESLQVLSAGRSSSTTYGVTP